MKTLRLRQHLFRLVFLVTLPSLILYLATRYAGFVREFHEPNARNLVATFGFSVDQRLEYIRAGLNTWVAAMVPITWQSSLRYLLLALGLALLSGLLLRALMSRRMSRVAALILRDKPDAHNQAGILQVKELSAKLDALNREKDQALSLLRLFVEHTPAAIAMFDRDMRYLAVSRRFLKDYRIQNQDIIGRSHYEVFPELPAQWKEIHKACLAGAVRENSRDPFPRGNGHLDWIRWEIKPWYQATGGIGGLLLFSEVITEWVLAEEKIRASLEEKEILIQELLHRTNNNMQNIEALMVTHSLAYPEMRVDDFSRLIARKIQALALVYHQLCRTQDFSHIDLAAYLRSLAELSLETRPELKGRIVFDMKLDSVQILFDIALALGLSVLELLSDIIGRFTPEDTPSRILLELFAVQQGGVYLRIDGDGILKALGDEPRERLELQLVYRTIRDQLKGSIEKSTIESRIRPGTVSLLSWIIQLPNGQYRQRINL